MTEDRQAISQSKVRTAIKQKRSKYSNEYQWIYPLFFNCRKASLKFNSCSRSISKSLSIKQKKDNQLYINKAPLFHTLHILLVENEPTEYGSTMLLKPSRKFPLINFLFHLHCATK